MSITLGIDLSLCATGIVRITNGKLTTQKLVKTKPTCDNISELQRLLKIRSEIETTDVDIAVIEGLAFSVRNSTALVQLSGLNYLVRELLYENKIPFILVAPTSLKKFATNKGNCQKDEVMLACYKRWHTTFKDNNLSDAFILAKIGEALLDKEVKLTTIQQEVITLLQKQL